MWADNETDVDLLGFSVHKDLILKLVTNPNLLPLTVGIFGDWGGGKSSVMRMLETDLKNGTYDDVACLYFSGWVFEGYDDAKAALFSSILMQLGEHKRFGPSIRDRVVRLLKKLNVMRVLKLGFNRIVAPAAVTGIVAGVATGHIDPGVGTFATGAIAAAGANTAGQKDEAINWQELINKDESVPGPLDIRSFRDDFADLLAETKLKSLVVLIDDLDRCAPDRLIENLEAIKLFLAVPGTAFVIAADQRIVRHAISTRYKTKEVEKEQAAASADYDLIKEYLEKLIQIPYHLPRLSPSEIESYMTLLFCRLHLTDQFDTVRTHFADERTKNLYITYGAGHVTTALNGSVPPELAKSLQWSKGIAPSLTESLKGNPRQVKRFLNALLLRKQLADIAKLANIKDEVLIKLMLLEYSRDVLFDELYKWQAISDGYPPQLKALENAARTGATSASVPPTISSDAPSNKQSSVTPAENITDTLDTRWQESFVQQWLMSEPPLQDVDLRDYFWIARDRLTSITGVSMVAPYVRRLFEDLISDSSIVSNTAALEAAKLEPDELVALLRLLAEQLQRRPSEPGGLEGLVALTEANVGSAVDTLLEVLGAMPSESVPPNAAYKFNALTLKYERVTQTAIAMLERWAKTKTAVGAAAPDALRDIRLRIGTN